jgi:pimeloyl-ACP methyl ester carboxylesterase
MHTIIGRVTRLAVLILVICFMVIVDTTVAGAQQSKSMEVAKFGSFYVGGRQFSYQGNTTIVDQMYVEYFIPAKVSSPYPIVMIHGTFQSGTVYLGTPDGREGWAQYFLQHGYPVYVVDQVARGRSPYNVAADGPLEDITVDMIEHRFAAVERFNLYPQAHLHTQWPGTAMPGDPVFDQFWMSQMPSMIPDNGGIDAANRADGVALLRRIGPAILLTHSRSGDYGWEIADDAPQLVKGIISIEPWGPPCYRAVVERIRQIFGTAPSQVTRPFVKATYGLTVDHLTYDPPVNDLADLAPKREDKPQGPDLVRCWFPTVPHTLPHLIGIPEAIVSGEASFHAAFDHCTSQYLTRMGVANDLILLGNHGIHGNTHLMMIEKNNLQIAALLDDWVRKRVKAPASTTH